jgi:hypothetical protein
MTGSDRKLVDLIMELTDFGTVWPLNDVVQHWGRDRAARVVSDGFEAAARPAARRVGTAASVELTCP